MTEKKDPKIIYNIKIILLGESGVDKTQLINVFLGNGYNDSQMISGNPCQSFQEITINDKFLNVALWDTMGQEKYRSLTKNFINESNIVIFVYDISRKDTILELDYWYNILREELNDEEVIFGVVANKMDLFDDNSIQKEEGVEYSNKIGASFFETSAKLESQYKEEAEKKVFKKWIYDLLQKLVSNENIMSKIEEFTQNDESFHIEEPKKKKIFKCCN